MIHSHDLNQLSQDSFQQGTYTLHHDRKTSRSSGIAQSIETKCAYLTVQQQQQQQQQ